MSMGQANQQKKRSTAYVNNGILESLRDISDSVGKTVTTDVAQKIASDALGSIFGSPIQTGGELRPNQTIDIAAAEKPREEMRKQSAANREIIDALTSSDDMQVKRELEAVRQELSALAKSITCLQKDVEQAVLSENVNPGIYHLNYYEQLRVFLRQLRMQIDDSRTWLEVSTTKRKKRGYWSMYKKHGTTFGLSNERILSTQTG